MSDQKALQGSETETRELLGGTKEKNIFPTKGSMICPPSLIFYKKELEKNELVARPGPHQAGIQLPSMPKCSRLRDEK